ncbi:MAG: polysaccharide lyase family 7 protein [Legionellaceae bacterium]|nr:polysaccharide lyase family 7 protein [Legionellaceae bacterium]
MKQLISTLFILMLTSPLFANPDPSVTLQSESLGYPYAQPFKVTAIFSEPVTGFGESEINIVNGTVSNLVGKCDTVFTMTITPTFPGPITMFVPAKVVKSLTTGSFNLASNKLNIMALNPILNPSANFDLSLWTLILPLPLGGIDEAITIASNTLIGHPELNTGYSEPPYFFTEETTGAMVFFAPLNGATTPNAVFPRSELSEYLPNSPHTWKLNTYKSNTLTASLLITQMPPSKKIVVGKIQDKGNPDDSGQVVASKSLVKIYYDLNQFDPNGNLCNGCIYARIRPIPAQDIFLKTVTLANNVPLNKLFIYKITLLNNGTLRVNLHLSNASQHDRSTSFNLNTSSDNTVGWGTQELFFKAGVYVQDNGTSNSIGGAANFYSLQIKHVT